MDDWREEGVPRFADDSTEGHLLETRPAAVQLGDLRTFAHSSMHFESSFLKP